MKIFAMSVLLFFLVGCAPVVAPDKRPPPTPTNIPTPQATATPALTGLWVAPSVPDELRRAAAGFDLPAAASPESAAVRLEISPLPDSQSTVSHSTASQSTWVYALVAPFPTISDGVNFDEVEQAWAGQQPSAFAGKPLLMAQNTYEALKSIFNSEPANGAVRIIPAEQLTDALWQDRPQWGVVPFEALNPKLKVLTIDDQSPIHKNFDPTKYPLQVSFILQPSVFIPSTSSGQGLPPSNRDPQKLTTVIMTGTSALVRAIAAKMEENGVTYPGSGLRDILREADILHISNEVSFAETCPLPIYYTHDMRMCSRPNYIDLFTDVGVDVVEATGNHVNNWDVRPFSDTLKMYTVRGWQYFGGGQNLTDAQKPLLLKRNGTRLALIGCNENGPEVAYATATLAGAAPCGDYAWILAAIRDLRARGYLVIVTQQYNEYYQPRPTENQAQDFARLADAGATIVSGSQAHYPQTMTFLNGAFVHYGLGNLFFDQMSYEFPIGSGQFTYRTRDEFLDRHVFYNGEYISTELLTAELEDYARPRPMTPEERLEFLTTYFAASGW